MKMSTDNYIISENELAELLRESEKLRRLENAGVDNWEYYDEAMSLEKDEEDIFDLSDSELTKNYPRFEHPLIFK